MPADLEPQLTRAGVDSTVLVQAAPTVAETLFMLELAGQHSFIAGVVGWVDFESPVAPESIATLAADASLLGLRPMIQDIPDVAWMLKPGLAPAVESMIDHDLVFDAPPLRSGDLTQWRHDIAALARHTNAVCKLSGLVTEAASANPAAIAACVDHLLEAFGPARLMWGSDWPVCELVCSYDEWYQASEMLLVRLEDGEREHIYSGTARETYGI
jgi:L-fuconolactonase